MKLVLKTIKENLAIDPKRWHKVVETCVGVSEETTTGVKRLYEKIGRAHVRTPVTEKSRMPSSA